MPRCENCGTDWEGGHLCINPHLSGVLNPWSRFTDDELWVFQCWNASLRDMVVIPDNLREADERLAIQLTAEIQSRHSDEFKERHSGGTT